VGLPDQLPATRPDGSLDPAFNNSVDQAAIAAGKLVFDPVTRSWTSPGGLVYDSTSKEGNRVNHVLSHLVPKPGKQDHTIFTVDRTKLIETIDEAFGKRGGGVLEGNLRVFEIDMGRQVGANGETRIRIIIRDGTRKVISAYPIQ
jgi:filamentous hemagglutinin